MREKQPPRKARASSRGMHVSALRMAVFSSAQPSRGLVTNLTSCCLLHWPQIPLAVGPQSAQGSIVLPQISGFPTKGERGRCSLAGRGGIAFGPPTADSKTAVLAGSTTNARVSAFGTSWSQRWRPSSLDQTNQTRTRWRGRILCLDKLRRPMRFLPWLPFWSPLGRP